MFRGGKQLFREEILKSVDSSSILFLHFNIREVPLHTAEKFILSLTFHSKELLTDKPCPGPSLQHNCTSSPSSERRMLQPTRCNRGEQSTSPCSSFNAIAARLPRPAECAPAVPRVSAATGASLSQRAEHVPVPLARHNRPRLPRPAECAAGMPLVCAASGASR